MERHLDWSKVQAFLAVAETGTLSGAARQLNLTQPTLGRQVKALETQLNTRLFDRHARGLKLTAAGADLVPAARAMREAAARLEIGVASHAAKAAPAGTVRVTASEVMSNFILPAILAGIRRDLPRVQLELVATDRVENLLFREADMAVRMARPVEPDMIATHVADMPLGLYAAGTYLARRGTPETPDEFFDHDLVGFDRSTLIRDGFRAQGLDPPRDAFGIRCDAQPVFWQLVRAGCGIGPCPTPIGDSDPTVARVLPDIAIPALPVWLTTHPALFHTPAVGGVWRSLRAALRRTLRAPPAP